MLSQGKSTCKWSAYVRPRAYCTARNLRNVLQRVSKWPHQDREMAPGNEHRVVPAPLYLEHVTFRAHDAGRVELCKAALEVGRDDPEETGECQQRQRLAIWRWRHVCKWSARDALVETLEVVDAVYRRVHGEQHLDVPRYCLVRGNDCP